MKYFTLLTVGILFLASCGETPEISEEDQREDILENGKWVVESIEVPLERINRGIKFSKDKQVFYIDSQGRVIPTYSEIVYEIKGDTLRIVDFKYEQRFIHEKGTLVTLIKEISDDRVELEVIHPEKNKIVLKKQQL
tara:strand:- start:112671 stop:113081 length:411 start_codon:yes stop_codon:yes gene_type:complete